MGQICNRLMGNNTQFPGPPMAQLPFDRNPMVLLGSYMTNLAFNMQRMIPLIEEIAERSWDEEYQLLRELEIIFNTTLRMRKFNRNISTFYEA